MRKLFKALPFAALGLIVSCSSSSSSTSLESVMSDARDSYADLMFAQYSDVVGLATDLQTAITTFLATPTDPNLTAAKAAWNQARPYYQQTEIARFYDGPIDDADGPEGDINAWPLDEVHIDYVSGMPNAGIINDAGTYPTIDEATLRAANGAGGEANVALGWHAIEFLLWGQDSDVAGPGARPLADYTATLNFARRATYLSVATQLLIDDLTSVRDEWTPTTGAYRITFLAMDPTAATELILTGMATLAVGELRGERILVPFNSKSQEDEHSCFSDTTHDDHIQDGIGVRTVWLGEYDAFDSTFDYSGLGMEDVFAKGNATLGTAVNVAIDAAVAALQAQQSPFDQAILGLDTDPGRVALQACLDALNDFNVAISNAATALSLTITTI